MMSDWGSIRLEAAQVLFVEGGTVTGSLHLLQRVAYPPGPETPLDTLNRPEPFFAVTTAGGPMLVSKAQVAVVSCHHPVLPVDPDRLSATRLVGLEIVLSGGRELRGHAALELPPGRSRTLDYVNSPGAFFALQAGDTTHYVNKAFIRFIRPLD